MEMHQYQTEPQRLRAEIRAIRARLCRLDRALLTSWGERRIVELTGEHQTLSDVMEKASRELDRLARNGG